jgi:hypothetical protein
MPLELGIFLGAKRFGNPRQREKSGLILEREPYRYQIYCSDIAGQDIRAHGNTAETAIRAVRNWLSTARRPTVAVPSPRRITARYITFRCDLPAMCRIQNLDVRDLTSTFFDYRTLVTGWLDENEW